VVAQIEGIKVSKDRQQKTEDRALTSNF